MDYEEVERLATEYGAVSVYGAPQDDVVYRVDAVFGTEDAAIAYLTTVTDLPAVLRREWGEIRGEFYTAVYVDWD